MTNMSTLFCTNRTIADCDDPFSILIFAILALANVNGSSVDDILSSAQILCPDTTRSWTTSSTLTYIQQASKRGILTPATSSSTWAVNAAMVRVNPVNKKYFCICQLFQ